MVTILVPALKALLEVVLILVEINVVAVIPVAGVLVRARTLIVGSPTVLAVGLSGAKSFLVTVVHRPS